MERARAPVERERRAQQKPIRHQGKDQASIKGFERKRTCSGVNECQGSWPGRKKRDDVGKTSPIRGVNGCSSQQPPDSLPRILTAIKKKKGPGGGGGPSKSKMEWPPKRHANLSQLQEGL